MTDQEFISFEPDELGLRLLPSFMAWSEHDGLELKTVITTVKQGFANGPPEIAEALREAWAWLNGAALLIPDPRYYEPHSLRILSRRGRRLAKERDLVRSFKARLLAKDSLHPTIREDVWGLFHRGKYDTAVFEVMKAVEVAVRTASGLSSKDLGAALMRKAFDPEKGALTDPTLDYPEREARAHLFAGAIGCFKNPHSHRNVALDDPDEAAEVIMFGNLLLRIVDLQGNKA